MKKETVNRNLGSSFSEFLKEENMYEEVNAVAIKRILAWELEQAMSEDGVTKSEMARRMRTSRSQLDRVLDPGNDRIKLGTLLKAAHALGRDVKLELV